MIDFAALIGPVARRLWGEPNAKLSKKNNLRWGKHGSKSVDLEKGSWFDHEANKGGGTLELVMREMHYVKGDAMAWLEEEGLVNGETTGAGLGQIAATYDYHDEVGELLFQVVRFDPKDFRQRRPDGRSGWIWKLGDVRRVLYRLPELIEAVAAGHVVAIAEGEKDVENLRKLGIPATTNPGGASEKGKPKWRPEYNEYLRGADVVLLPHNDDAGRGHMRAIAASLAHVASRVRILDIAKEWPECPHKGDISDWIEKGGTAQKFWELAERAPEHGPDHCDDGEDHHDHHGDAPHPDDYRQWESEQPPPPPPPPLPFVNMSSWDQEPVPQQEWSVPDRYPLRQTVLCTGEGAVGKSIVRLQLSAAHVLGKDWLGTMPEPGPALFVDAEDDENVLHIRLAAILKHYGATFADAVKGGLYLISLFGHDTVLVAPSRSGTIEPTPLYKRLLEAAGDIKPKMITIASSADVYAGDENVRPQVRQFVNLLTRIAIVANGTVALIAHPSRAGTDNETGISGNTAWHNSVRARDYMRGVKAEPGEQPDSDLREIIFKKNQYGPIAARVVVKYQNGLFLPVPGVSSLDQAAQDAKVEDVFLTLLRRFNAQNRSVSDKIGTNYAPAIFAKEPEAKAAMLTGKALADAMRRLFAKNAIVNEPSGKPSRRSFRLAGA